MMRSDMPKQINGLPQWRGLPSLATVPMETTMGGSTAQACIVNQMHINKWPWIS